MRDQRLFQSSYSVLFLTAFLHLLTIISTQATQFIRSDEPCFKHILFKPNHKPNHLFVIEVIWRWYPSILFADFSLVFQQYTMLLRDNVFH